MREDVEEDLPTNFVEDELDYFGYHMFRKQGDSRELLKGKQFTQKARQQSLSS
jgi:hypothetical protein